jgi:hypothetical protein
MRANLNGHPIKVFSTCPPSNLAPLDRYLRQVIDVARRSAASGCEGTLVYVVFEQETSRVAR